MWLQRLSRRKLLRNSVAGVAAFGMAGALLEACSGGSGPSGAASPSAGGSGGGAAPLAKLTVSQQTEYANLTPLTTTLTEARNVQRLFFDPLVGRDHDGKPIPMIAKSWERTSDTHWKFHIREGVKFSDGSPLQASDVVYSLGQMQQPTYQGPPDVKKWTNIVASDPLTVDLDTAGPDVQLMNALLDASYVLSEKYSKATDAATQAIKPMGSGPYTLKEWIKGDHLTALARSDYWGGKAPIDTVVFRPIPDENTRIAALLSGQVDMITQVDLNQISRIKNAAGYYVSTAPDNRVWYVAINTGVNPAFADAHVRQALNYAVDKDSIIKTFFEGQGVPVGSLAFPGCFGYSDAVPPYPYDPGKATQLLKSAGFDFSKTYTYDIDADWKDPSLAVVNYLNAVGVKTQTNVMNATAFVPKMQGFQLGDFFTLAYHNAPLDMGYLYSLTVATTGGTNWTKWSNPEVDAALHSALTTFDPAQEQKYLAQVDMLVRDQAPYIFLLNTKIAWGVSNKIKWSGRSDSVIDVVRDFKGA